MYLNKLQKKNSIHGYYIAMFIFLFFFEILSLFYLIYIFWYWTLYVTPENPVSEQENGHINSHRKLLNERSRLLSSSQS
jgi:hypothetical protein